MVLPLRRTNTEILISVNEGSTLELVTDVTESDGTPVVPSDFKYTLTDRDGNVINGLLNVDVPASSSSVTVTLAGDDLQIVDQANEREYRILTIETDQGVPALPLVREARFWVINMVKLT